MSNAMKNNNLQSQQPKAVEIYIFVRMILGTSFKLLQKMFLLYMHMSIAETYL